VRLTFEVSMAVGLLLDDDPEPEPEPAPAPADDGGVARDELPLPAGERLASPLKAECTRRCSESA
jgi:hypothetical protein